MKEILAIARNTFKEAVRNRILYTILIFALLLILVSGVVSELTIASRDQIIKSLVSAQFRYSALPWRFSSACSSSITNWKKNRSTQSSVSRSGAGSSCSANISDC